MFVWDGRFLKGGSFVRGRAEGLTGMEWKVCHG